MKRRTPLVTVLALLAQLLAGLGFISNGNASNKMQNIGVFKTVLLNSGYSMPVVGLGTYSLSDQVCANAVSEHLKAGGRLIDTAFIYGNEQGVGQGVRQSEVPREEVFVITKLYPSQYANAEAAIEMALDKLDLAHMMSKPTRLWNGLCEKAKSAPSGCLASTSRN